jgi:hypothetical protein
LLYIKRGEDPDVGEKCNLLIQNFLGGDGQNHENFKFLIGCQSPIRMEVKLNKPHNLRCYSKQKITETYPVEKGKLL